MKYPSNAAPSHSPSAPSSPKVPRPPAPANDNFPRPPNPANDNVRPGRTPAERKAVGKYLRWLKHPLLSSAAMFILGSPPESVRPNLEGYIETKYCAPGGTQLSGAFSICGTALLPSNGPPPSTGRPLTVGLWQFVSYHPNGIQQLWARGRSYRRVNLTGRNVEDRPLSPLYPTPRPLPSVPALNPIAVPPNATTPVPRPVPYPLLPHLPPNPHAPGGAGRSGGYYPPEREKPSIPPWQQPGQTIEFPVAGPVPVSSNKPHDLQPPKQGEKEKKLKTPWADAIMKIVGNVTEVNDLINALYGALPVMYKIKREYTKQNLWGAYAKDYRDEDGRLLKGRPGRYLKPLTPQERADAIYRAWDKLDHRYFAAAFEAIRKMEVTDRLYGHSSSVLNKRLRRLQALGYVSRGRWLSGPAL